MSTQQSEDTMFWGAVASFAKFGSVRMRRLYDYFGSMEDVWKSSHSTLLDAGISDALGCEFVEFRKSCNVTLLEKLLTRENIHLTRFFDPEFPELLGRIYDPPAVLFVRGVLQPKLDCPIAVVGSRKMSHYGEQIIEYVVPALARQGCGIISGLALGVDGHAHEQALKSDGYTVAVLGSGNDTHAIYPRQHLQLAHRIVEKGGAVISEFAPNTPPLKNHFPLRNRIISGMSLGVFVVEAAERSGSLITARVALEQNREVFAAPGSIFSQTSKGCNSLISLGAHCVTSADDILNVFQIEHDTEQQASYIPASEDEAALLQLLSHEAMHIDDCISRAALPAARVMTLLTMLETKRIVKQIGGMRYIRTSKE